MTYQIGRLIFIVYYHLLFRLKISGQEHIPKSGAVVLCMNHTSNNDPMVMSGCVKRQIHFIAKKELFKVKFFGFVLEKLGAIMVDRSNPAMNVYKEAVGKLKQGKILGIFAQGTRASEIEATDAKAGVALFALKGDAVILPAYIESTYRYFSSIRIKFGNPISLEAYKGKKVRTEELNKITEEAMGAIAALAKEEGN